MSDQSDPRSDADAAFSCLAPTRGASILQVQSNRKVGYMAMILVGVFSLPVHASQTVSGIASFYGTEACRVNPDPRCPTADGSSLYTLLREGVPYAASWDYPFGTTLRVCRADQHDRPRCVRVVVRDRGPSRRLRRLLDLNPTSFRVVCGSLAQGLCRVTVERVDGSY